MRAVGDNSTNRGYLLYASAVFSVVEIDGAPQPRPATDAQMDALGDRLGNDGLAAVHSVLYGDKSDKADPVADTAKN